MNQNQQYSSDTRTGDLERCQFLQNPFELQQQKQDGPISLKQQQGQQLPLVQQTQFQQQQSNTLKNTSQPPSNINSNHQQNSSQPTIFSGSQTNSGPQLIQSQGSQNSVISTQAPTQQNTQFEQQQDEAVNQNPNNNNNRLRTIQESNSLEQTNNNQTDIQSLPSQFDQSTGVTQIQSNNDVISIILQSADFYWNGQISQRNIQVNRKSLTIGKLKQMMESEGAGNNKYSLYLSNNATNQLSELNQTLQDYNIRDGWYIYFYRNMFRFDNMILD